MKSYTKSLPVGLMLLFALLGGCAGHNHRTPACKSGYNVRNQSSQRSLQTIDARVSAMMEQMTLQEKLSQLCNDSPGIERVGIPPYNWWNEALHGVARAGRATVFPQAIGLAATFDEALMHDIGHAIALEARAKYELARKKQRYSQNTGLTFWSPNVNIFRDPRWGRGQETYGEDPFLTSQLASAWVRGLQGDDQAHLLAAACAKHLVAHSGPESGRESFDSLVSPRDLEETYLPAFRSLVDAGVAGVMCAYNRLNGEPCCSGAALLTEKLRTEWGFEGYVVSDCSAIGNLHNYHHVTTSAAESAALALRGGVDLNCGSTYRSLGEALDRGLITEQDIDRALARLLRIRMQLGELDPTGASSCQRTSPDLIASPEHLELARRAAAESVVLLKNKNNILPLSKDPGAIYVVGPNAASIEVLLGNYRGISDDLVTILEGIVTAAEVGSQVQYRHGCLLNTPNATSSGLVDWEAKQADVIIAVLGSSPLMEGETGEAIASQDGGDRDDVALPPNQLDLLHELRDSGDQPLIVVLTGGSPIIAPEVVELADALLFAWYPGEQGGAGVADLIFGDVAPSGRLPVTFPASLDQLPPYEDYSMQGRTYRFMHDDPLFPFGFGLTYGRLAYSDLKLQSNTLTIGEPLQLQCTLQNQGNRHLEEVVQMYFSALDDGPNAPRWSLCDFQRVTIAGGEKIDVTATIIPEQMTTVDDDGVRAIRPGRYRLTIGGSSPMPRSVELGAATPVSADFTIHPAQ